MVSHFNPDLISKRAEEYFAANSNVLVVEDDRIMGQMVSHILTDAGFEVTTAGNGRTALEKLQQKSIDFIILDVLLPEMDGFEIYQRLQDNPDTKDIPVMIVTAWADSQHMSKAKEVGIKHFLAKPFTEDELLLSVLTLLVDSSYEK
jgi:CheY-like chemotaxis protein